MQIIVSQFSQVEIKGLYASYKNEVSDNGITMEFPKFAMNKSANAEMLLFLKYPKYPDGMPTNVSEFESDSDSEEDAESEDEFE